MTIGSSSASRGGHHADGAPGASSTALIGVALVAVAIPIVYVLLAYAALRLSLAWFPPRNLRHETDPTWVLYIAIYAPLVLVAAAMRLAVGRLTAGLKTWHWALAALLASLLLVAVWQRLLSDGAADAGQTALAAGVFFALMGPGLWLGGWCRTAFLEKRAARERPISAGRLRYPKLHQLMGAWFHQDFDIEDETVAEIMAAFRAATPPAERAALRTEIAVFIAAHPDDLDQAFESTFRPHVDVAGFSGSTRMFLSDVDAQLEP